MFFKYLVESASLWAFLRTEERFQSIESNLFIKFLEETLGFNNKNFNWLRPDISVFSPLGRDIYKRYKSVFRFDSWDGEYSTKKSTGCWNLKFEIWICVISNSYEAIEIRH